MNNCFLVDSLSPISYKELGEYLYKKLKDILIKNRPIIFLCIGTDRATGDSLGPIIGYKLKDFNKKGMYIYGSLESPIHALNLSDIISKINNNFNNPFIIAIDASLGDFHNIGKVLVDDSPLNPGLALNKSLLPVGDISIKGIVNISNNMDFLILQNTRLYIVMTLADCISNSIKYFINKCSSDNLINEYLK